MTSDGTVGNILILNFCSFSLIRSADHSAGVRNDETVVFFSPEKRLRGQVNDNTYAEDLTFLRVQSDKKVILSSSSSSSFSS